MPDGEGSQHALFRVRLPPTKEGTLEIGDGKICREDGAEAQDRQGLCVCARVACVCGKDASALKGKKREKRERREVRAF